MTAPDDTPTVRVPWSERCWCGRPVPRDEPDAFLCREHDNAPPLPRPGIPRPGMGTAIGLALVCFAIAFVVLVTEFSARYEVVPSPAGPTVVEVAR